MLLRKAQYAAERAKIELSLKSASVISMSESEIAVKDAAGEEIYLDIALDQKQFNSIIEDLIEDSIKAVRQAMEDADLTADAIERIVFIGGPTNYKPLCEKVAFELGIAASTDINPMTAVAEGASIFAESVDWDNASGSRKSIRGKMNVEGDNLSFNFIARTPSDKAQIVAKLKNEAEDGAAFQIDCLDTGWSSGRVGLKDDTRIEVPLLKRGENSFKIFVFDAMGGGVAIKNNRIIITRASASIDAIPASSSIGVEVLDRRGGKASLAYLVKKGETLPKKGQEVFKAGETLRAGQNSRLNFKLWEGQIAEPVHDNQFIGTFSISGTDFDAGIIMSGSELICDYEITDAGNIILNISVPSIGGSFESHGNFYSREAGEIDYSRAAEFISRETENLESRVKEVSSAISAPEMNEIYSRLDQAHNFRTGEQDAESAKQILDGINEAKKILAELRQRNLKPMRQIELDECKEQFARVEDIARDAEKRNFENIASNAQRAIDTNLPDFEILLGSMNSIVGGIYVRQDWFVIDQFKYFSSDFNTVSDKEEYSRLLKIGREALEASDIDKLREINYKLGSLRASISSAEDIMAAANIVRG